MIEKIQGAINFIREARDDADTVFEHIIIFSVCLLMGLSLIFLAFVLVMVAFDIPKVFLPIYVILFVLWHGYKRL